MSITETTTTINHATARTMKRSRLEDALVLFAAKSVRDEAEIARLNRVVEQATRRMEIRPMKGKDSSWILLCNIDDDHFVAHQHQAPDLYAQLKRGEQNG